MNINPQTATEVELDVWLAINVMGWVLNESSDHWLEDTPELERMCDLAKWKPSSCRNFMAVVLAKITDLNMRHRIRWAIAKIQDEQPRDCPPFWYLLTAPPSIVARAIVAAYQEQRTGGPR